MKKSGKYSPLDIANFFIALANSLPDETIDNLKLNKLCYYAQGWALTRLGYPLYDESIEAWSYGPVVPTVYQTYKICGNKPISEPNYIFDESTLSSDELSLLTDVYSTYAKYTSNGLVSKTHERNSPWSEVFEQRANKEITPDSMIEYFSHSDELEEIEPILTAENVVTYD